MGRTRRGPTAELPLREELEALTHWYHHLQNAHERAPLESSLRRRLADELLEVRGHFDRMLEEWIADEELREEWRAHLKNRVGAPAGPEAIRPLVFKGRSEAGSTAEVRRGPDALVVEIDGALVERVAAEKDLASDTPPLQLRLDGTRFDEVFDASPDALEALGLFLGGGGSPPWDHASELLRDGLIDVHFDLTRRGRRALAQA